MRCEKCGSENTDIKILEQRTTRGRFFVNLILILLGLFFIDLAWLPFFGFPWFTFWVVVAIIGLYNFPRKGKKRLTKVWVCKECGESKILN